MAPSIRHNSSGLSFVMEWLIFHGRFRFIPQESPERFLAERCKGLVSGAPVVTFEEDWLDPEGLGLKRLYLTAGVPSSPPFLACKCFRFPSATSTLNSICFGIKSVINCGAKQGRKSIRRCTHLFLEISSCTCGYISCTNENFDVNLSKDIAMVAHKGRICTEVHEGCVMNFILVGLYGWVQALNAS